MKPYELATEDEQTIGNMIYQSSSRIQALEYKRSKSIGASCNTFRLGDNVESIGAGANWGIGVLAYQGAPSWDLSDLRPIGSKLGTHGTSSGAVSFGRVYDSIVSQMRREEKKNGAGILSLDHRHKELDAFLNEPYKSVYKMVYLPMHDTPEAEELLADTAMCTKLAKAFNEFKCFLVKRPLPLADGTELLINLCTEIEIPHKGFCVLGALNLSQFRANTLAAIVNYFRLGMHKLVQSEILAREASLKTANLRCDSEANRQVGLGVYGLASLLGALEVSYAEFNSTLSHLGVGTLSIEELANNARNNLNTTDVSTNLASSLIMGYFAASKIARDNDLRAAFCIQPTVSTSQRSFDYDGYNVSAEIQPVEGIIHEHGVSYLRKSAVKGDKVEVCHPKTWTTAEVSYETYARTSSLWQQLMDSTGLAHRHSHCFYGEEFGYEDFVDLYIGKLKYRKSMYYRLPFSNNVDSLRKDKLWQDVEEGELFDLGLLQLITDEGGIGCAC